VNDRSQPFISDPPLAKRGKKERLVGAKSKPTDETLKDHSRPQYIKKYAADQSYAAFYQSFQRDERQLS
jgi:hypothetical protein